MANTDRKWQETGALAKAFPWLLVSQNIFSETWPQNPCVRYIQNKFGAAAEGKINPKMSLVIYSERSHLQTQQLFSCTHTHFHTGWPHNPKKHHSRTKYQAGLTMLLTHADRCVWGVWESLREWRQWWEIANTTGLMYSFQGQAFSPTRLVWWITLCAAQRPIRMPAQLPRGILRVDSLVTAVTFQD